MTTRSTLRKAAVLALGGIAVIATAACGAASAATVAPQRAATTVSVPVVVNCGMKTQTRPGTFTLACADGNVYLSALSWSAWGSSSALASGNYSFNDCTPNCLSGHGHTLPGLMVLWGAQALPGHSGVRYFTEMTVILTGNRSYTAGGKKYTEPQTQTVPLSRYGGA
ncbi:MAG TPA: hypothetical protein VME19_13715 [Streptosporangiaceae bacterium]|nr:hypothetical protein [Streptosporangiaceae bacterium]